MKRHDAIVIGAGVGGLAAAAYLAKAGKRVLLLEREAAPPEPIGPVYALDPVLLKELRLKALGLRFFQRDMPLALPDHSGGYLLVGRDGHQAVRALGAFCAADAAGWTRFRREVDALAGKLRRWWESAMEEGEPDWVLDSAGEKAAFTRLSLTGADAFLAAHFECDAAKAALLFDASAGGFHVSEPGSALALVWRAAQEMAARRRATAVPVPGTLAWSLIKAAGDMDFRCCATVAGLVVKGGAMTGVRLADGEEIEAGLVLSSLSAPATLAWTGAAMPGPEIGEARLLIVLREKIAFPAARLILAERPGIYADAHEAARAGRLGHELPMEFAAEAPDRIAVTLRPVPGVLRTEDRVQLAARAVQALSRHSPGAARLVSDVRFSSFSAQPRATLAQLLAPSLTRVKTKIAGLYLCGADAEPLASLSGRAARLAVRQGLKYLELSQK